MSAHQKNEGAADQSGAEARPTDKPEPHPVAAQPVQVDQLRAALTAILNHPPGSAHRIARQALDAQPVQVEPNPDFERAVRQLNTVRVLIRDDTKEWAPAVRSGALIALSHIEAALAAAPSLAPDAPRADAQAGARHHKDHSGATYLCCGRYSDCDLPCEARNEAMRGAAPAAQAGQLEQVSKAESCRMLNALIRAEALPQESLDLLRSLIEPHGAAQAGQWVPRELTWRMTDDGLRAARRGGRFEGLQYADIEAAWKAMLAAAPPQAATPFPAELSSDMLPRDGGPRFRPQDGGKWISDEDFIFDAKLRIDGDWGSDEQRAKYAQAVADALNGAPPQAAPAEPLTDERIVEIRDEHLPSHGEPFDCIAFARALLSAASNIKPESDR